MSATLSPSSAYTARAETPAKTAVILVATDGSEMSDAALAAADRLAASHGWAVEVLTVLEPMPIISPEAQLPITAELETERRADRIAVVRRQVERITGSATTWPTELGTGVPAALIARRARDLGAKLVVIGLGKHRLIDRVFGSETALQVLRLATIPVLCVPARGLRWLPRRVLAAVDFSDLSIEALRTSAGIIDDHATVTCAHVISREQATGVWEQWQEIYTQALEQSFNQLEHKVDLPPDITVEASTLVGDPASELLHAAEAVDADLIVTGSHGHNFLSRMLLGSVATGLIRGAKCSVLAVPQPEQILGDHERAVATEHAPDRVAFSDWAPAMAEFTTRNTGRRSRLEVDDPELGAQAQEVDYPLLGVTYDHRDARVEIMVGELGYGGRHLTRSIGDVRAIDVLRDEEDRDVALRVQHGAGQTLLTLTR